MSVEKIYLNPKKNKKKKKLFWSTIVSLNCTYSFYINFILYYSLSWIDTFLDQKSAYYYCKKLHDYLCVIDVHECLTEIELSNLIRVLTRMR